MKKALLTLLVCLLTIALFVGCGDATNESTPTTASQAESEPTTTEATTEEITEETPDEIDMEYYTNLYADQIARYYTALSTQWEEGAYLASEMSSLAAYYYEGNALDNVGYAFIDFDNNGICELVIGAILNAEEDPSVFEIWTIKDEAPAMLIQGSTRNRYFLQLDAEVDLWTIANEAENGAANHAVYYLQMFDGELEVSQGVIFDATADEANPWFMAYDLDWDVSNDEAIEEDLANDIIDAGRRLYIAAEYIPLSRYN